MVSVSHILHLPCTRDLIEGGIAYALHSLPYQFQRVGGSTYDRLRHTAAGAAVDLAFRHYLSEQSIPFKVKAALPFTEHDRYDLMLGGQRCEVKSFLISHRDQIAQIQQYSERILSVPALVASDQHAAEGHSPRDWYLFAFLIGQGTDSQPDLKKTVAPKQPNHLVHVMPETWNRPLQWNPLGKLVLKSEADETQIVELGGQEEGRSIRSIAVALPPRRRVEIPDGFFSLSYIHTKSRSLARIGIYSPIRRETYLIEPTDWGNLWIDGKEILLAGYIAREEFRRRASFLPAGSRVFQYDRTQVKNLALPVSELRPLSELLERLKAGT